MWTVVAEVKLNLDNKNYTAIPFLLLIRYSITKMHSFVEKYFLRCCKVWQRWVVSLMGVKCITHDWLTDSQKMWEDSWRGYFVLIQLWEGEMRLENYHQPPAKFVPVWLRLGSWSLLSVKLASNIISRVFTVMQITLAGEIVQVAGDL